MCNLYQSFVLDILKMFELPSNVEGDMYGPGTDVECWSYITLQRVAHHQQLMGQNLQMLTEVLEFCLSLIRGNLYMREVFSQTTTMEFVFLIL